MKWVWLVATLFLSDSVFADGRCEKVFWGLKVYVDENNRGDLVRRTDVFPFIEWSEHSQFHRILIEKSRSLLAYDPQTLFTAEVKLRGTKKSLLSSKTMSVQNWSENPNFLELNHDFSKPIPHGAKSLEIVFKANGKPECKLKLPVIH